MSASLQNGTHGFLLLLLTDVTKNRSSRRTQQRPGTERSACTHCQLLPMLRVHLPSNRKTSDAPKGVTETESQTWCYHSCVAQRHVTGNIPHTAAVQSSTARPTCAHTPLHLHMNLRTPLRGDLTKRPAISAPPAAPGRPTARQLPAAGRGRASRGSQRGAARGGHHRGRAVPGAGGPCWGACWGPGCWAAPCRSPARCTGCWSSLETAPSPRAAPARGRAAGPPRVAAPGPRRAAPPPPCCCQVLAPRFRGWGEGRGYGRYVTERPERAGRSWSCASAVWAAVHVCVAVPLRAERRGPRAGARRTASVFPPAPS